MKMETPRQYVILVAAGSATRFGGSMPKQFMPLDGVPVAAMAAQAFAEALPGCAFVVALPQADTAHWQALLEPHMPAHAVTYVPGGATRWESVKCAVEAIPADAMPHAAVLVHDAARPLVPREVIERVVRAVVNTDGVVPVVPVTDSLRRLDDNAPCGSEPVDRALFRAVQTPQGATLWRFREAYAIPYDESFTDDASVLAAAGFVNIVTVEGSPYNIKITNPLDLDVARAIMTHISR